MYGRVLNPTAWTGRFSKTCPYKKLHNGINAAAADLVVPEICRSGWSVIAVHRPLFS